MPHPVILYFIEVGPFSHPIKPTRIATAEEYAESAAYWRKEIANHGKGVKTLPLEKRTRLEVRSGGSPYWAVRGHSSLVERAR